jgi:hypothetical protein
MPPLYEFMAVDKVDINLLVLATGKTNYFVPQIKYSSCSAPLLVKEQKKKGLAKVKILSLRSTSISAYKNFYTESGTFSNIGEMRSNISSNLNCHLRIWRKYVNIVSFNDGHTFIVVGLCLFYF